MANDTVLSQDDNHLESTQPGQVAPTCITTVTTDPVTETGVDHLPKSIEHPDTPGFVAKTQEFEMTTARDRGEAKDREQDRSRRQRIFKMDIGTTPIEP